MIISEKNKAINNKAEQNKTQYNSDRETAKTSALSSEGASKYEFLTDKDVIAEKLAGKSWQVGVIKIFEYSLRHRIEKANYCCRKAVSKFRQCFWI